MATEIERKFRVRNDDWKPGAIGKEFRQGYLSTVKERTVRVRTEGDRGVLTIKGITRGVRRAEFEYTIPFDDATLMLDDLCELPLIEKTRYRVTVESSVFEIDEFHAENEGLVVAEIELRSANQPFPAPAWLGAEVSNEPRYFNANLVKHPFAKWSKTDREER